MFFAVRSFFAEKEILEVDCPAISRAAPIDLHIEVMNITLKNGDRRYLHTSPEYGMKRLLALGLKNIYQMSHVFRENEIGPLHNPEFTMIEWYRNDSLFTDFIEEALELIYLFLGKMTYSVLTYRELFYQYTRLDYLTATPCQLQNFLAEREILISEESTWDKDNYLHLIMTFIVEPHLGHEEILIIKDYPASQSALAKTYIKSDGEAVAERFEFYHKGIELGNGYHELTDPIEQRRRFVSTNQARIEQGKAPLPLDESFISALESGLPDCHGIAIGFDRLMLLRHHQKEIAAILPFAWN